MSSTALTKAIKTMESRQKSDARKRVEATFQEAKLVASGAAFAAGGLAGYIDKKRGTDLEPAHFGTTKIPINLTTGVVLVGIGLVMGKGTAADAIGGAGLGLAIAGGYRVTYDRTEHPADEQHLDG